MSEAGKINCDQVWCGSTTTAGESNVCRVCFLADSPILAGLLELVFGAEFVEEIISALFGLSARIYVAYHFSELTGRPYLSVHKCNPLVLLS